MKIVENEKICKIIAFLMFAIGLGLDIAFPNIYYSFILAGISIALLTPIGSFLNGEKIQPTIKNIVLYLVVMPVGVKIFIIFIKNIL